MAWNARQKEGGQASNFASGIYFYKIEALKKIRWAGRILNRREETNVVEITIGRIGDPSY